MLKNTYTYFRNFYSLRFIKFMELSKIKVACAIIDKKLNYCLLLLLTALSVECTSPRDMGALRRSGIHGSDIASVPLSCRAAAFEEKRTLPGMFVCQNWRQKIVKLFLVFRVLF